MTFTPEEQATFANMESDYKDLVSLYSEIVNVVKSIAGRFEFLLNDVKKAWNDVKIVIENNTHQLSLEPEIADSLNNTLIAAIDIASDPKYGGINYSTSFPEYRKFQDDIDRLIKEYPRENSFGHVLLLLNQAVQQYNEKVFKEAKRFLRDVSEVNKLKTAINQSFKPSSRASLLNKKDQTKKAWDRVGDSIWDEINKYLTELELLSANGIINKDGLSIRVIFTNVPYDSVLNVVGKILSDPNEVKYSEEYNTFLNSFDDIFLVPGSTPIDKQKFEQWKENTKKIVVYNIRLLLNKFLDGSITNEERNEIENDFKKLSGKKGNISRVADNSNQRLDDIGNLVNIMIGGAGSPDEALSAFQRLVADTAKQLATDVDSKAKASNIERQMLDPHLQNKIRQNLQRLTKP